MVMMAVSGTVCNGRRDRWHKKAPCGPLTDSIVKLPSLWPINLQGPNACHMTSSFGVIPWESSINKRKVYLYFN